MNAVRRRCWLLTFALVATLAGCGRDVAEAIQDNSRELSGLRRAIQEFGSNGAYQAPERAQIDDALAPLRDVLTQLGSAQRELAERQQNLTQEMRRWTMLIVQQQTAQPNAEATQLAARLEQLEQSLQQQDARHREVETLLQGALDHTADRLEDFLQRLEANDRARRGGTPTNDGAGAGAADPGRNTPSEGAGGGADAARPGAIPPARPAGERGGAAEGGGDDGENENQQAGSWWWWGLIALTLASGAWLLIVGRRHQPVAIAPQTRASPDADPPAHVDAPAGDGVHDAWLQHVAEPPPHEQPPHEQPRHEPVLHEQPVQHEPSLHGGGPIDAPEHPPPPADEPEVEELWAAAALLGEAIGKLKQNGVDPADAMRELPDAHDGVDLHDLFVVGEPELEAEPESPEPNEASASQRATAPAADAASPAPPRAPTRRAAKPADSRPATDRAPTPIHCWLPARDASVAAALVRQLLGDDPRVLVVPAPEVQPAGGELHVSFSVLPGLPAGERSLIEQRLRDGVA